MHRPRASRWPEPTSTAITGAASGIGQALALRLSRPGARLALADLDAARLEATAERCRQRGAEVYGQDLDVGDAAAVTHFAEVSVKRFGRIEGLCNIAGIINAGTIEDASAEHLELIMRTNFHGVVHGTTAFLPQVIAAHGFIVNISSAYGLISGPAYSAYNASKFAVRGWTDALRMEMKVDRRQVRVITVFPGGIRTPIMAHSTSEAGPADAAERREFFDTRVARTEPEVVAERIVRAIVTGKSRLLVGPDAYLADLLARISGAGYERLMIRANSPKEGPNHG